METRNEINETVVFPTVFQMVGNSMDNGSRRSFANGDDTYLVRRVTNIDDEVVTCTPLNPLYKESQLCIDDILQMFIVKSFQIAAI